MGSRSQTVAHIAFLAALTLAIYLGTAFSPALLDDADSVHAEAAREILERGDWVTLHANGVRYLEKAPLMYWLMAAAFSVFGVTEAAARLPLVLGTLAFVLTLYAFGRVVFDARTGFYAGLAGATSFGVFLFTRITIPEILLAFFVTAAFLFFVLGQRGLERPALPGARASFPPDRAPGSAGIPARRSRTNQDPGLFYYGMYVMLALAVLTKGLIGVLLPGGIVFVYLLLTGRLRPAVLLQMRIPAGTLVFLAIAAPWHILAGLRNEKFFWFYFMNEHFLRYLGKRAPVDYDTVPLLAFYGLHLVWLFPWTPFLVLAARRIPHPLRARLESERTALFLWIWAAFVVLFFSFSTRQEYYTFTAYPAMMLLAARALADLETAPGRALLRAHWALAAVGVAAAVGLAAMVAVSLGTRVEGDIATVLTKNPEYYALSLGHIFDLTPDAFAALRFPALGAALALAGGALTALWLRHRRRDTAATVSLALMAALFFFCAHSAYKVFNPYLSSKLLADVLAGAARPGDRIVIDGEYESGSTLNFYTGRQVHLLNGRSANLWWGSFYPDAPRIFLEDRDLVRMWHEGGRVFLFLERDKQEHFEKLLGPVSVLARSGGKLIVTNR